MAASGKRPLWKQLANAILSKRVASVRSAPSADGDHPDPDALADASACLELAGRVAAIYAQTPRAVLYIEQVAAMLEVSDRTCAEVMTTLVRQRLLRCTSRGEYVLR